MADQRGSCRRIGTEAIARPACGVQLFFLARTVSLTGTGISMVALPILGLPVDRLGFADGVARPGAGALGGRGQPFGAALGGVVADRLSISTTYLLLTAGIATSAVLVWFSPLREVPTPLWSTDWCETPGERAAASRPSADARRSVPGRR